MKVNKTDIKTFAYQVEIKPEDNAGDKITELEDQVNLYCQKNRVLRLTNSKLKSFSEDGVVYVGFTATYNPRELSEKRSDVRIRFFTSTSLMHSNGFLNRYIKDNRITGFHVIDMDFVFVSEDVVVSTLTHINPEKKINSDLR